MMIYWLLLHVNNHSFNVNTLTKLYKIDTKRPGFGEWVTWVDWVTSDRTMHPIIHEQAEIYIFFQIKL